MLRSAKKSDAGQLAKIHFIELKDDFLPSLGESFLRLLYLNLIDYSEEDFVLVDSQNGKVRGFICGSLDFNKIFKKIIKNNFFKFSFLLVPQLIKKPGIFVKIFETFFYPYKEGVKLPRAELIVICVLKKYHRKGIGSKLVQAMEKKILANRIRDYKVTVNAANKRANYFYSSLGFFRHHSFYLYGKKINLYTKRIK